MNVHNLFWVYETPDFGRLAYGDPGSTFRDRRPVSSAVLPYIEVTGLTSGRLDRPQCSLNHFWVSESPAVFCCMWLLTGTLSLSLLDSLSLTPSPLSLWFSYFILSLSLPLSLSLSLILFLLFSLPLPLLLSLSHSFSFILSLILSLVVFMVEGCCYFTRQRAPKEHTRTHVHTHTHAPMHTHEPTRRGSDPLMTCRTRTAPACLWVLSH